MENIEATLVQRSGDIKELFVECIMTEVSHSTDGSLEQLRAALEKFTPILVDNLTDTEKKLAEAFEEIHRWRARGHRDRMDAFISVKKLAENILAVPKGEAVTPMSSDRLAKFFKDLDILIAINQPRSEVVGDEEGAS